MPPVLPWSAADSRRFMGAVLRSSPSPARERETKKPAFPPASLFFSRLPRSGGVGGLEGCGFLPGDRALHGRLHLFEGADFDLPHAFARHAEFGSEVFQRHRIFRQTPRLEDAAVPGIEHADRAVQRAAAMIELLVLGHDGFLVGRIIDQPVLPFNSLTVV